ncbi:PIN domain-like protein [Flammula alnicola]|nr:PIN domain-like protein [Flammula alnicola]
MGVKNLWKVLSPAVQRRYFPEIAVREGFEGKRHDTGVIVLGIDASAWFFQCQTAFGCHPRHSQAGQNPELKALFYRLAWLSRSPTSVLFVFDGPGRPKMKRGKHVRSPPHWMTRKFRELAEGFGFYCRTAPGEAEAELAFLNEIQAVDLVVTNDSDIFLFGATHNRDNVEIYTADAMALQNNRLINRAGFLFLAVMHGGDYSNGLRGCGLAITTALAKGPLPALLYDAITNLTGADLVNALRDWNVRLKEELESDPWGWVGGKHPALARQIPEDFPSIEILQLYRFPLTSQTSSQPISNISAWLVPGLPDTRRLAILCESLFGWGPDILTHFCNNVWDGHFIRHLVKASISPSIAPLPGGTPLGPDAIRYITLARTHDNSPSIYPSYRVEIWLSSVTIEAFNAIRDSLPSGHLAPGSSSIISLRLWVPGPIMTAAVSGEVETYHAAHPGHAFSPRAPYIPILSDVEMAAASGGPAQGSVRVDGATGSNLLSYIDLTGDDD